MLSLKLSVCSGFSISWKLAKSGVFCLCFQFSSFSEAAWTLSTNALVLKRLGNFAVALSSCFLRAHFAFGKLLVFRQKTSSLRSWMCAEGQLCKPVTWLFVTICIGGTLQ